MILCKIANKQQRVYPTVHPLKQIYTLTRSYENRRLLPSLRHQVLYSFPTIGQERNSKPLFLKKKLVVCRTTDNIEKFVGNSLLTTLVVL